MINTTKKIHITISTSGSTAGSAPPTRFEKLRAWLAHKILFIRILLSAIFNKPLL